MKLSTLLWAFDTLGVAVARDTPLQGVLERSDTSRRLLCRALDGRGMFEELLAMFKPLLQQYGRVQIDGGRFSLLTQFEIQCWSQGRRLCTLFLSALGSQPGVHLTP